MNYVIREYVFVVVAIISVTVNMSNAAEIAELEKYILNIKNKDPRSPIYTLLNSLRNLLEVHTFNLIQFIINSFVQFNISTLKCYSFDFDSCQAESSIFLLEMEEKIHYMNHTKWEEDKMKKTNKHMISQSICSLSSTQT